MCTNMSEVAWIENGMPTASERLRYKGKQVSLPGATLKIQSSVLGLLFGGRFQLFSFNTDHGGESVAGRRETTSTHQTQSALLPGHPLPHRIVLPHRTQVSKDDVPYGYHLLLHKSRFCIFCGIGRFQVGQDRADQVAHCLSTFSKNFMSCCVHTRTDPT